MNCALFGSMAVMHQVTPRRHIRGAAIADEPGLDHCSIRLDEGVHLRRPGMDVVPPPRRIAASFRMVLC